MYLFINITYDNSLQQCCDHVEFFLHRFIIPLRATIDNKYDGDQTATLTLKQVIDGFHKETVISKVTCALYRV